MFPLEFPLTALAGAEPGSWCLDPFCGRGTTLYAARLLGLNSIGVDVNAVAVALAAAKLVDVSGKSITALARKLLATESPGDVPTGEFWRLAFHPTTLMDLCRLRAGLLRSPSSPTVVALRALVLGVLHGPLHQGAPGYLSNQMPRTYATKPAAAVRYWQRRGMTPPEIGVLGVISRRAAYSFSQLPPKVGGRVLAGDARTALRGTRVRFSRVVTSPPYYGMRTYEPDQWLRAWFLGGPATVDHGCSAQLPQSSLSVFVDGLAQVWSEAAERCERDAQLWVRFGVLPSREVDAAATITRSLERGGWDVVDLVPAGAPPAVRRQANQFTTVLGPAAELDCRAVRQPAKPVRGPGRRASPLAVPARS